METNCIFDLMERFQNHCLMKKKRKKLMMMIMQMKWRWNAVVDDDIVAVADAVVNREELQWGSLEMVPY